MSDVDPVPRQIGRCVTRGLLDAVSLHRCLILIVKSEKIRLRLAQCLVLNGLIFLGSIFLFSHIVTPLLRIVLARVLASPSTNSSPVIDLIQGWIEWTYFTLWIVPVYLLSFILNAIWYQDIAVEAIRIYPSSAPPAGRPQSSPTPIGSIVEVIFRSIFSLVFLLFLICLARVRIAYFLYLAFLLAYNAFEYRWISSGILFTNKIATFEKNWIYFLSFGAPVAAVAVQFPSIIENGLISIAFPFLLMTASTASRPVGVTLPKGRPWWIRLPLAWLERLRVFIVLETVTNAVIAAINLYNRRTRSAPQTTTG